MIPISDLLRVTGNSYQGVIDNNTLRDVHPESGAHPDGIQMFAYDGYTPHDITISGNYIYDDPNTGQSGLYMQGISRRPVRGRLLQHPDRRQPRCGRLPELDLCQRGDLNVVIKDNSLLSWTPGGGGATIRLTDDTSGVTVDGNVMLALLDEGGHAKIGDNLIYSNSSSSSLYWGKLFEGVGSDGWQGFVPKDGSAIDFGSHYGAQDRLQELLTGSSGSSGSGSSALDRRRATPVLTV